MGQALRKGVACGQKGPRKGEQNAEGIELKDQGKRGEAESNEKPERLPGRHFTGGNRPQPGSLDVGIKIPVRIVIDDAASGSHQNGSHGNGEEGLD